MPDGNFAEFTPGRYVISWIGAKGARDPIGLTSQVKVMREGLKEAGHTAALVLIVVADDEQDAAVERITKALDAGVSP